MSDAAVLSRCCTDCMASLRSHPQYDRCLRQPTVRRIASIVAEQSGPRNTCLPQRGMPLLTPFGENMDKKIAGLLGAAAALVTVGGGNAAEVQGNPADPGLTYRSLLNPVPNAVEALKADEARRGSTPKATEDGTDRYRGGASSPPPSPSCQGARPHRSALPSRSSSPPPSPQQLLRPLTQPQSFVVRPCPRGTAFRCAQQITIGAVENSVGVRGPL